MEQHVTFKRNGDVLIGKRRVGRWGKDREYWFTSDHDGQTRRHSRRKWIEYACREAGEKIEAFAKLGRPRRN